MYFLYKGVILIKTKQTKELEKSIYEQTGKLGVFCCLEVTINNERVDYLTFDTKGIWRCYEIKVSKEDFYSKAKKTFVGHYNYYVMPNSLYEEVKEDIPKEIGVYTSSGCIKRAKKHNLGVDEQLLKNSMIRSLYRYFQTEMKNNDEYEIHKLKREVSRLKKDKEENYRQLMILQHNIIEKYGYREYRKLKEKDN